MAGHSRWKTRQARRLAETGDAGEHPEYEQAGRDLRLGDQLWAIRRSRNLAQKEVAERAGISQPALARIELGGGVPDIETLRRLGNAMGVRFHVIVGDLARDWTLKSLAAELHLAPGYLVRLFNAATGLPPMAYLGQLRAEHAAVLLLHSDEPVTSIGRAVGWPDQSGFRY